MATKPARLRSTSIRLSDEEIADMEKLAAAFKPPHKPRTIMRVAIQEYIAHNKGKRGSK